MTGVNPIQVAANFLEFLLRSVFAMKPVVPSDLQKQPIMKKISIASLTLLVMSFVTPQAAQAAGSSSGGPKFDETMIKLFGDNHEFSADIEGSSNDPSTAGMMLTGRLCVSGGMARADFSFSLAQGADQSILTQMKAMGMASFVSITRPDRKMTYLIYPGMKSYVETGDDADEDTADPKTEANPGSLQVTEMGKESLDGHACVKNKVVMTDADGSKEESLVWNARDLHNFPIRIQTLDEGRTMTLNFRNVSLSKPASSLFEVPSGYTRYTSMQAMMQGEMMKRMGSMSGMSGMGESEDESE